MGIFDEAAEVIEDEFGSTIKFVPNGGSSRTIPVASVWWSGGHIKDGQSHQQLQNVLNVMVRKSSTPLFDNLTVGDSVIYQNKQYDFLTSNSDDGAVVTAQFIKVDITQYGKKPSQL